MRFRILAAGAEMARSDFEFGDPPMGVVWGLLRTTPRGREVAWSDVTLSVRAEDGRELKTIESGGVVVEDHREELDDEDAIEVRILGLLHADYVRYFPHHIEAYAEQYKSNE